ncbi:hypothetical protein CJ030_MR7G016922 [Morella rubra]|uniref:Bifunctional inhibitor/plant lipid transfer protein/seed storage helical domain-containing protein n=1 Tax=Morella rubra TaxID=262757 RepID=A0A6A1UZX0_9ROSI|nr:hypothetical protein CJ030_MR7G016922 [Morella rubra]
MASNIKTYIVVVFLIVISSKAFIWEVDAEGDCGRNSIFQEAVSFRPCLGSAQNARIKVPAACCAKVASLLRTAPRCLCAVLLSPIAKQVGVKPQIGVTIPKRCNIKNRYAGRKCGVPHQRGVMIGEGETRKNVKSALNKFTLSRRKGRLDEHHPTPDRPDQRHLLRWERPQCFLLGGPTIYGS